MEHGRICSEVTDATLLKQLGLEGEAVNLTIRTLTDDVPEEPFAKAPRRPSPRQSGAGFIEARGRSEGRLL